MLTDNELNELVLMLQNASPLVRLTNMEARTVFELMQQRGYTITKPEPAAALSSDLDIPRSA
jgi:hypothetical protein